MNSPTNMVTLVVCFPAHVFLVINEKNMNTKKVLKLFWLELGTYLLHIEINIILFEILGT